MKRKYSIRTKIIGGLILLALVISSTLVCVSYYTYKSTMDKHYETLGDHVAQTAISLLDENKMLEYSRRVTSDDPEKVMAEADYQHIRGILSSIKDSNQVLYLYMIYPTESGSYFIFDTDESEDACPYGYFMEYYEGSFDKITDKLVRGERVPAVISDQEYGWIISISYPYISSSGELVGYVCVDISMDQVVADRQTFLLNAVLIMAAITLVFTIVYLLLINNIFVRPVKQMTAATEVFISTREDERETQSPISALQVNTGDELQTLCESLKQMESDLNSHIENLKKVTAEKERIGAELDVARHIQASMLPCIFPPFPDRKEFEIFASMNPAKEVGGDFYDFFMVDDTHLAVVMADVSGKGVPAALFMVIGKTLIKDHTQPDVSLGEVFSKVNNMLCDSNSEGLFITAFEGVLDLKTGEFRYVNAGHEPPYICKQGESYEPYKIRPGFVLAGMEDLRYREGQLQLSAGNRIFLYTDGVTEATNGNNELYGFERLHHILNENTEADPEVVLGAVKQDVDRFVGEAPQFDDITMLCLEYRG